MSDGAVSEVCEGVGVEEVCVALGAVFESVVERRDDSDDAGTAECADGWDVSDEGEESKFARAQVAGAV